MSPLGCTCWVERRRVYHLFRCAVIASGKRKEESNEHEWTNGVKKWELAISEREEVLNSEREVLNIEREEVLKQ